MRAQAASVPPPTRAQPASVPPPTRAQPASVPPPSAPSELSAPEPPELTAAPTPFVVGHESFDDPRDEATRIDPRPPGLAGSVAGSVAAVALRAPATFRRRSGWSGDVAYVFTVLAGGASARRELARGEAAIEQGRLICEQRLIALGADAIGDARLEDARLAVARDALGLIEEERSAKAGQAAAAEADLDAIERNQRGELAKQQQEIETITGELARIAATLAPLDKDAAALRRRARELGATLAGLDDQIRSAEGKAASAPADRAGVEAELATVRADRAQVAGDEPGLAALQADLEPRIAAFQAERARANRRLAEARAAIVAAGERAADEQAAVKASRKVIDRALGELEKRRDRALGRLGEHLAGARPRGLTMPIVALDQAEAVCAGDERRVTELREMLSSVERAAFARGVAILIGLALLLGAFGYVLATR